MLFAIFVVITLLEIYVLASVGGAIGGFLTVLLVIITALIGSVLLKQQGFSTLRKVQEKSMQGQTPAFEMLEGLAIIVSGILLLTPGFITDALGLLGLMPWSRHYLIEQIAKNTNRVFARKTHRFFRQNSVYENPQHGRSKVRRTEQNNTIEGEFWEE